MRRIIAFLTSRRHGVPAAVTAAIALVIMMPVDCSFAEPSIAVRTGYRCSECHVNHTGGGMRTPFGSLFTQLTLPQNQFRFRDGGNLLPADPDARFAVGGDLRFQSLNVSSPDGAGSSSFEETEGNLFVLGRLLPGRLNLYVDEHVGPGGAQAREAFAVLESPKHNAYLKFGKFLPPYGYRLPDDIAYIRQFTGFSYSAPDIGVEAGIEPGKWSAHLAVVNGSSGGGEENRSKQFSFAGARRFRNGRIGISGSNNITGGARVTGAGAFGGWNLGRLTLLGEGDARWSRQPGNGRVQTRLIGFAEADLLVTRGVNIKFAHDWTDPDRSVSTDSRARDSLGVEWIPYPFVQLRLFARRADGPPQVAGSRDRQIDLEAHIFF